MIVVLLTVLGGLLWYRQNVQQVVDRKGGFSHLYEGCKLQKVENKKQTFSLMAYFRDVSTGKFPVYQNNYLMNDNWFGYRNGKDEYRVVELF